LGVALILTSRRVLLEGSDVVRDYRGNVGGVDRTPPALEAVALGKSSQGEYRLATIFAPPHS